MDVETAVIPNYLNQLRNGFSERLGEAMIRKNIVHAKNSNEPDPYALSKTLGVTLTMGGRYLAGRALPENKKIAELAAWLEVDALWLLYGRKGNGAKIDTELFLSMCDSLYGSIRKAIKSRKGFADIMSDAAEIYNNVVINQNKPEAQKELMLTMVSLLQKNTY